MFCPVCGSLAARSNPVRPDGNPNTYYIGWCGTCDAGFDQRIIGANTVETEVFQSSVNRDFYKPAFNESEFEAQVAVNGGILGNYLRFCQLRDVYVEIGVGLGLLTRAAAPSFARAYGLDLEVESAGSIGPTPPNVEFWCHREFLDKVSGDISALCAWHVIEHLPNPHAVLEPLFRRMPTRSTFFGQVPLFKPEYVYDAHFVWHTEKSLICFAAPYGFYPIYFERDEVNDFLCFCFRRK